MMTTMHWLFIAVSVSTLIACGGGGGGGSANDGLEPSVSSVLSDSQLAAIETLGVQINLGDSPPDIEGTFFIDPIVLQATSVPDNQDSIGNLFFPLELTFFNQNIDTSTVEFTAVDDEQLEVVTSSSFVSGSGNAFTAYFLTETTVNGQTFEATDTYSGIVTDVGIENFQRALIIVDDRGDPNDIINPNDTGNLFIDEDGFSERLADDGANSSVLDLLSDAQLDSIEAIGLQINSGDSPPDIEGSFFVEPLILQATSLPDGPDIVGGVFLPLEVTFSNQNNATRTIELALEDGSEFEVTSTDSFLSGEGNAFTAYFLTETTFDGQTFDAVDAYSGMVTEAGIENFQRALLIVDDRGDPGDRVSPNGSTDLFFDMDALSERVP